MWVLLAACSGEQAAAPNSGNANGSAGGTKAANVSALPEVTIARPTRGVIVRSISLPAQVLAERQATIYAKVPGYLRSMRVDKGDKVAAGTVLATIEVPELEAARARQQAELKAAESEYQRLNESLLKAPDLVVPQMVDVARGKYEVARASLQQSETMLRYATITAPFAGVITQRFVDAGALIPSNGGGGSAGAAAIATLMDFSAVRLHLSVPEVESANVKAGQPVSVTTDDLPGAKLEGKVARFSYALDTVTRTMLTEVSLPNATLQLRPGMMVTAKIGIQRHDGALLIPAEAVVTDKSGTYVWILNGDKAARRAIKAGFNDGKNTEITEGLAESDAVILAGKVSLKEGAAVKAMAIP
jgi:RND family efflux transporter MFP subunit